MLGPAGGGRKNPNCNFISLCLEIKNKNYIPRGTKWKNILRLYFTNICIWKIGNNLGVKTQTEIYEPLSRDLKLISDAGGFDFKLKIPRYALKNCCEDNFDI